MLHRPYDLKPHCQTDKLSHAVPKPPMDRRGLRGRERSGRHARTGPGMGHLAGICCRVASRQRDVTDSIREKAADRALGAGHGDTERGRMPPRRLGHHDHLYHGDADELGRPPRGRETQGGRGRSRARPGRHGQLAPATSAGARRGPADCRLVLLRWRRCGHVTGAVAGMCLPCRRHDARGRHPGCPLPAGALRSPMSPSAARCQAIACPQGPTPSPDAWPAPT